LWIYSSMNDERDQLVDQEGKGIVADPLGQLAT
jgi:hypothetical protein